MRSLQHDDKLCQTKAKRFDKHYNSVHCATQYYYIVAINNEKLLRNYHCSSTIQIFMHFARHKELNVYPVSTFF